ncbi:MAG: hydrogenase nickel incorporation protein HypB [Firmicutes bacterium]|nr:hydrogenase nickel incorporation protein HypB [Bacillota bacterium]
MKKIEVMKDLLADNKQVADSNRKLLSTNGIFTINLLGSPGAGKTTLLEKVIRNLKDELKIAVIEGDLYTTNDADRIAREGVEVIQLNTKSACHLEANMVREVISDLNLSGLELLFIENVGNLVCTASFDLGEDIKLTVLSVTEGSDKPIKYPLIFQNSEVVILNKMDLLKQTDFSKEQFYRDLTALQEDAKVFEVSCASNDGIRCFSDYLQGKITAKKLAGEFS